MTRKSFPPTLCRLCGHVKAQGTDLCSSSAKRTGILFRINKRLSKEVVHIAVGDGLPQFVCSDCEVVVNDFADFCKMVHDVQKRLEDEKLCFEEAAEDKKVNTNTFGDVVLKAPIVNHLPQEENEATVSVGPDGKVECKLCRNYLEAVEHTTLHMVTHGIGTVICSCRLCGHRAELARFLRGGNDKSSLWCDSCRFQPIAEKKKTDNTGRKLHPCEICSKVFRSKAHLSRHCIVHSGAKPFLCEVCGAGFGQKSSLKLHVLSHSGLNPHKCEHCGQSFRFKDSLRSHVMSLHWPAAGNQTVYQCDQCDRQFATVYKLRRHYRSHTGERPYECNRCGRLFSQTCNLNLHRKKHEEEDARNEQYDSSLLVSPQDPVLLVDSILQHPVAQCAELDDPDSALSLLQSGEEDSDHTTPYVSLNPEYLALGANSNKKAPTELFPHFGHDDLLYMDQGGEMQDSSPNEAVTLPTFSSLQPVSTVTLSNLTH